MYNLTIAIPTYKRSDYVEQALRSALKQNKSDISYEVIVVNNDPEADMTYLEKKYTQKNLRFFVNEKNLGMIGNMKRCLELAQANFVAFLHDDDLLLPNYVESIEKYLRNDKLACLIPSRYLLMNSDKGETLKRKKFKEHMASVLFFRNFYRHEVTEIHIEDSLKAVENCYYAPTCGTVFNKKLLAEIGGFDESAPYAWDYLSFLKINENYPVYLLHKYTGVYRMEDSASNRPNVQYDFFATFYRAFNERFADNKFVKKYKQEIDFLNNRDLSEEARAMVKKDFPVAEGYSSKAKYVSFMVKRQLHLILRNLDGAKLIGEKQKDYLKRNDLI